MKIHSYKWKSFTHKHIQTWKVNSSTNTKKHKANIVWLLLCTLQPDLVTQKSTKVLGVRNKSFFFKLLIFLYISSFRTNVSFLSMSNTWHLAKWTWLQDIHQRMAIWLSFSFLSSSPLAMLWSSAWALWLWRNPKDDSFYRKNKR